MKIQSQLLFTAVLALGLLAGCNRHAAPVPSATKPSSSAAVRPLTAKAPTEERAAGMAEETDSATDVSSGLSPIASAVAANTPAVATPIPSKWVDGKNYNTLTPAQPTGAPPDKVEVVEVFWYGCGHCYHLDPSIESWRQKGQPPYVMFQRVPVMWGDVHKAHARLFYTLEALGKLEELHTKVFREIHANGNFLAAQDPAETERLQRAFLKANGVSDADFDRTYRSFSVEGKLQRAEQLTRRYRVAGVPLMVVNGKYTADVGTAGGEPQLLSLVGDLAASERKH
jgi:protein dithiol oxidoreductase (disulfide-forming)